MSLTISTTDRSPVIAAGRGSEASQRAITRRTAVGLLAAPAILSMARARPARAGSVPLFRQPVFTGTIANNFTVSGVAPAEPTGQFVLHANQLNPFTRDGSYVPVNWNAQRFTGVQVPQGDYQRGIFNTIAGTSTAHTVAQLHGGQVGVYIVSPDLIHGSTTNGRGSRGVKQMITAAYLFPDTSVRPFAAGGTINMLFDLQIPVCVSAGINGVSNAYVSSDFRYVDRTGNVQIAFEGNVFSDKSDPAQGGIQLDSQTGNVVLGAVLIDPARYPACPYLTIVPGSAYHQMAPWSPWKRFAFSTSRSQFQLALRDIAAAFPGKSLSMDPSDYYLAEWHLNAETHSTVQLPSTMGWSLQNVTAWLS